LRAQVEDAVAADAAVDRDRGGDIGENRVEASSVLFEHARVVLDFAAVEREVELDELLRRLQVSSNAKRSDARRAHRAFVEWQGDHEVDLAQLEELEAVRSHSFRLQLEGAADVPEVPQRAATRWKQPSSIWASTR